jgi:hypothetical protein
MYKRAAQVNMIAHHTVALSEHAYPEHNLEFVVFCQIIVGNVVAAKVSTPASCVCPLQKYFSIISSRSLSCPTTHPSCSPPIHSRCTVLPRQHGAHLMETVSESLLASGRDGYEAIFPYERFVVGPLHTAGNVRSWLRSKVD